MKTKTTRELALIAMGAALIAVCSWLAVPTAIPFTLQTFAVCLVTAVFVPVFSGFKGGIGALLGTTGGYLAGFLFTALTVGVAVDRFGRKLPVLIASMALGILLCYAFGTAWFVLVYTRSSGPIGVGTALGWCVLPYLLPDAVKIALAALLTRRLVPILNRGEST